LSRHPQITISDCHTFRQITSLQPARRLISAWGVLVGGVSISLLFVGGLDALRWAAIVAASPFVLILIGMCAGPTVT
jgi:glycine betaine transporter